MIPSTTGHSIIDAVIDEGSDCITLMPTSEASTATMTNGTLVAEVSDEECPPPKELTMRPSHGRSMSRTSEMYDRQHKGYLDPTEAALRRMDSKNQGFLDVDKVYLIMSTLQSEQRKSAELISNLQQEQVKANQMKRGILYLCTLAIFLALSNIGTSFAAARLAKDTEVQTSTVDLVTTQGGMRVATTAKIVEVTFHPIDLETELANTDSNERRRMLQEVEELACSDYYNDLDSAWDEGNGNDTGVSGVGCAQVGQVDYSDAVTLYQTFCPNWPFKKEGETCEGVEINEVMLNCGGKLTRVLGGEYFPTGGYPGPLNDVCIFQNAMNGLSECAVPTLFPHT